MSALTADQIATLETGDPVIFDSATGTWGHRQIRTGKVVRLTPTQIVVHYTTADRTIETRFRKSDGRKVGEGYGYLLDPEHPSTASRLVKARKERRRQSIDSLAARWSRERDNLDLLRHLQVAIGEYLDAES